MSNFHLRGTGQEDHSLLNEDQVVVKKNLDHASRWRPRLTSCRCWTIAALLAAIWLTVFGLWLYWSYFRNVGGAVGPGPVGVNVEAELVVLPEDLADETGAYCLDGSPPSYYFRNASSDERQNFWIIHLTGDAWCYNDTECAHRSATDLGSSRMPHEKKLFGGILSSNFTVNPDFYDWNVAVVNYCDGASFSGDREDPVIHNNTQMYYRGSRVLDAVVNHLLESAGLQEAQKVILSGESAGALAVYLHADHVSSMVPDDASFKAVADGGFFVAEADTSGENGWESSMKDVYQMQQVEGGLDEDCMLAKGKNKWECFFAQYAYPYVTTPMFVINSVYDAWAARNILGVQCRPSECSEEELGTLGEHMRTFLQRTDQINRYDKDGMFLTSCFAHVQASNDDSWMSCKVAGRTTRAAFADWYYERTTPDGTRDVDCGSSLTCNPTCN